MTDSGPEKRASAGGARLVGAGILLSRVAGFIRQRVFAHYFGNSDAADVFNAAFRIPNFLQNLFGEGVLSASFIPVYSRLLAEGKRDEADRVAGAAAGLLALVTAGLVLIGVLCAPLLVAVIAPGFAGPKAAATEQLVRILFPGAGLFAWSAWCLGVLNSHRRFLISYTAPVLWNLAMIATLILYGAGASGYALAEILAWGSVVGSAAQFGIQVPPVLKLLARFRPMPEISSEPMRRMIATFGPVFLGRGVVQISAMIDSLLASLLGTGAVAGLAYAQLLYTLPISLFGMSVSAAELPEMSRVGGGRDEVAAKLLARLEAGLERISLMVIPSAVGFLALGDVIAGALFQTGAFGRDDSVYVWAILAGSSVGLLASALGRLYSTAFYALHDTATPLKFSLLRITLSTCLGYLGAVHLTPALGFELKWGAAALTACTGFSGWIEYLFLRRALARRIGSPALPFSGTTRLWGSAITAAAVAWGVRLALPETHPIITAATVLTPYVGVYFGMVKLLGRS